MVKGITYLLATSPTTSNLIGSSTTTNDDGTSTKVYPVVATQKEAFPLVTVWENGRIPQLCKGKRPNTFTYQYELHVYSLDYDEINSICGAIEEVLFEADVDSPVNGVQFRSKITVTNRRDAGYVDDYKAYSKVISVEAIVYEGQTT